MTMKFNMLHQKQFRFYLISSNTIKQKNQFLKRKEKQCFNIMPPKYLSRCHIKSSLSCNTQHTRYNFDWFCLVLWCLTPLSTIFQLYHVSFVGEGKRSTRGKPLTCRKTLTNFTTLFEEDCRFNPRSDQSNVNCIAIYCFFTKEIAHRLCSVYG